MAGRAVRAGPADRCDVVVVGAGISGLFAAARLARSGLKVQVLEANHQPGGMLASIWRRGFRFDVGAQSMEDFGFVFAAMQELGLPGKEQFTRVRHGVLGPRDSGSSDSQPGFEFDFALESWETVLAAWKAGKDEAAQQGAAPLVAELRATEEFFRVLRDSPPPGLPGGGLRSLLKLAPLIPRVRKASRQRAWDLVTQHLGEGPLARLVARSGYDAVNTLALAGFYYSWFHDYWYPKGGMGAWMQSLADLVESHGGKVTCKAPADRVLLDGGRRVCGVALPDGTEVAAPRVVWTGSPHALFGTALRAHPGIGGDLLKRAEGLGVGDALVSVYLGLDVPWETLRRRLPYDHTFYFPDLEVLRVRDRLDDPAVHSRVWVQLLAPGLHDEGAAPPGCSALVLQVFSDARWMNRWGRAGHPKGDLGRDRGYHALKKQVMDELLATASRVVPEIRDRAVWKDIGTPLSIVRFTSSPDGSTVGWPYHPHDTPFRTPLDAPLPQLKTKVPGLFTAGHWWFQPGGVPFAGATGWLAAGKVLGEG
jgi:prolycopene isomerase